MKYVIYGGSGFLGTSITNQLMKEHHDVVVADIRPPKNSDIKFAEVNLLRPIEENELLKNPDVVINLAGKLIFGRWNKEFKDLIRDTRVVGTRHIVETFSNEEYRPKYLINASAVGIYGDHGEEEIDEDAKKGTSFLSFVAKDWEEEARRAKMLGVEVRIIRNAHILGKAGLLGVLLPYYKLGIGGPLGNGEQWFPWVHIRDVSNIYINSANPNFPEIINAVAPETLTNKTFSKKVANILHRPHIFRIPKFALKFLYGEFADEMVISQKITSRYSQEEYLFGDLSSGLEDILKK